MMDTGLFFGSFNPIHIGHLAIANYMLEFTGLDKIWFIVSPHNPLKKEDSLLDEQERLKLVQLALANDSKIIPSAIEFDLPRPSYTIDTLEHLAKRYTDQQFTLILGSDNFTSFHQWKNYRQILAKYAILVYPRAGYNLGKYNEYENITWIDAPLMEVSSTFIRQSLQKGINIQHFLPCGVYDYIKKNHLYEK
ncbi:MAG: nicotinate (nicotinamide) nucleotide adenylyltransferase [Bacteroidales bacterium]|jgi:nicotinate-nucleotide adenylyltransferase|nr:nicotinate (nicotinamide) nucleotide adenylyltransferase [Bacteroidales bacterium]